MNTEKRMQGDLRREMKIGSDVCRDAERKQLQRKVVDFQTVLRPVKVDDMDCGLWIDMVLPDCISFLMILLAEWE